MLNPAADVFAAALAYALPAGVASSPANRGVRVYKRLRDESRVAITFDDGPQTGIAAKFLNVLDRENVRATFFVIGRNALQQIGLIREMQAAGHEIANHGFTHRAHFLSTPTGIVRDIEHGAQAVEDILGHRPDLYRPPHGVVTAATRYGAWRADARLVLWSKWGRDWVRTATPDSITRTATRNLRGGDIVLLHDADQYGTEGSWQKTLQALPFIIERIRAQGLEPSAINGAGNLTW